MLPRQSDCAAQGQRKYRTGLTRGRKLVSSNRPSAQQAVLLVCADIFAAADISAEDNVFMLGGTSLNVVEFAEALLDEYGMEVPLDAIFASSSLTEIATHCQAQEPASR
jgi:acyl carrier protein